MPALPYLISSWVFCGTELRVAAVRLQPVTSERPAMLRYTLSEAYGGEATSELSLGLSRLQGGRHFTRPTRPHHQPWPDE